MRIILVWLLSVCLMPSGGCETLGDVWRTEKLPEGLLTTKEVQQPITSYAVSKNHSPFLIAYYDDDGSEALPGVLLIIRFDSATRRMSRTALHGIELPIDTWQTFHQQVSTECMGSALGITEVGGLIEINTHIGPSAGCVLVLKSDLSFIVELFGSVLGQVGEDLILEENTVHFAPTHPLRVDVFNFKSKKLTSIYPGAHDAARETFAEDLRKHLPSAKWCAERNNGCDPEAFSADVEHLVIDDKNRRFSFDVEMNADGFGDKDDAAVQPKTAHYICRYRQGQWVLAPN